MHSRADDASQLLHYATKLVIHEDGTVIMTEVPLHKYEDIHYSALSTSIDMEILTHLQCLCYSTPL